MLILASKSSPNDLHFQNNIHYIKRCCGKMSTLGVHLHVDRILLFDYLTEGGSEKRYLRLTFGYEPTID